MTESEDRDREFIEWASEAAEYFIFLLREEVLSEPARALVCLLKMAEAKGAAHRRVEL
jgi:hypothetical protein